MLAASGCPKMPKTPHSSLNLSGITYFVAGAPPPHARGRLAKKSRRSVHPRVAPRFDLVDRGLNPHTAGVEAALRERDGDATVGAVVGRPDEAPVGERHDQRLQRTLRVEVQR